MSETVPSHRRRSENATEYGLLNDASIAAVVSAMHGDPFAVLGPHQIGHEQWEIRAFAPHATAIEAINRQDGRPLPPPTIGQDLANTLQDPG